MVGSPGCLDLVFGVSTPRAAPAVCLPLSRPKPKNYAALCAGVRLCNGLSPAQKLCLRVFEECSSALAAQIRVGTEGRRYRGPVPGSTCQSVVFSGDEKPSIHARVPQCGRERCAQGQGSTYERDGIANFFDALNVATGHIHAQKTPTKTRVQFPAFMDKVVGSQPARTLS